MLRIELEQEEDGRWIAEVPALPGVLAYASTPAEARDRAAALAFRVIADRIEQGEQIPSEACGRKICERPASSDRQNMLLNRNLRG